MSRLRWILSVLLAPLLREPSIPLVRPTHFDWNPSLSPRTIQIKGNAIFYVVKGEGEPLLLIHGYGAGSWVWEKQMDILSRNYKVYALDIIGYGYSDRINHPTLLIWGEEDLVFPPSVGESLHRAIKGSKFHLIQKSGHMPMWETPEEVNRIILDFLKEAT